MAQHGKSDIEMVEDRTTAEEMPHPDSKGGAPLMRSKADDFTVWQAVRRYKRVGLIAMTAAFCASLDGYRKVFLFFCRSTVRIRERSRTDRAQWTEINLNGGIISNKGFIRQFASPGTTIIDSKYVSAWGGIQSAGQFVGQVVRSSLKCDLSQAFTDDIFPSSFNIPLRGSAVNQRF
jgi:SP family general alpha glucoside:H+ symporter-like MFS transporter